MLAVILATILAVGALLATPWVVRTLPPPPEAPELDFGSILTMPFLIMVGTGVFGFSCLILTLTEPPLWPIWVPFVVFGVWLALVDARTTFLPNRLLYPALGATWLGAIASAIWRADPWPTLWAAVGAMAGAGLFWLIWRLTKGGIGFGDVRLAAVLGTAGGASSPELLLWIYLLGTAIGALWAVAVRLRGRASFAYGPSLLLGAPAAISASHLLGMASLI